MGESGLAEPAFWLYVQLIWLLFASILMSKASTVLPVVCAKPRGFVNVTPVPAAPGVPTAEMTRISWFVSSMRKVWPTARPVTLVTLMLVALIAELAARVVVATGVSVQSVGRKMSARWRLGPAVRMTMSLSL